jgi:NAD(P)-dependent dehydrogenase (short-subunit alcohol dehydrogenase family)
VVLIGCVRSRLQEGLMSTPVQQAVRPDRAGALVTGGSRGLGLQIAEALGEAGAKVLLTSRKAADLEEAAADLQAAASTRAGWPPTPATRPRCRSVVDEALQRLGRIDILVNNAGATWGAPAEDYPLEAWDKVMNLNIRSMFLFCQAVGRPACCPRKYGRIINVASIAGLSGSHDVEFIAYGTSKGAVVNFTRTLAGEWGPHGITVNALAPGFFPSKMTRGTLAAMGVDKLAAAAPLRRIGDDDDLKGAALLFASAPASTSPGRSWRSTAASVPCTAAEAPRDMRNCPFPLRIPLRRRSWASSCGLRRRQAEVRVDLAEAHLNSLGGGPRRRADDAAGRGHGHAARSVNTHDPATRPAVVTVEMKTSFMRPPKASCAPGPSCCTAPTLAFCEGVGARRPVHLCAHATGTFKYLRKAARGRPPKSLNAGTPTKE